MKDAVVPTAGVGAALRGVPARAVIFTSSSWITSFITSIRSASAFSACAASCSAPLVSPEIAIACTLPSLSLNSRWWLSFIEARSNPWTTGRATLAVEPPV